jgi:D-methionine transport system permease protein
MYSVDWLLLANATWQTIYMVGVSAILSVVIGGMVGILLFQISKHNARSILYMALSFIVNILRSVPFIILLICLIPFTRLIIGSSIGSTAAIVPLTISAIPFFARIMETALNDIAAGLLHAADAMGMTQKQIMFKVMLPESLSVLVKGATLLIISLIGFSAMAGVVGGGGLGEVAIDYGYQQFNIFVMLQTVIILVLLVQMVQYFGTRLSRKTTLFRLAFGAILGFSLLLITQVATSYFSNYNVKQLSVGVIAGADQQVMQQASKVAEARYHLKINIKVFDDYMEPNRALNEGSIDANIFQHLPFLQMQMQQHGYKLKAIAKTFVYPFGFYSKKITNLNQLADGAVIAVPADPSNLGRALLLLQKYKLISLKPGVGLFPTVADIVSNPRDLTFKLADSAMLPRILSDVAMAGIGNTYISGAGLTVRQALLVEGPDSPYANIIVIKQNTKMNAKLRDLIDVMHSAEVVAEVNRLFPGGAAIPAWKQAAPNSLDDNKI